MFLAAAMSLLMSSAVSILLKKGWGVCQPSFCSQSGTKLRHPSPHQAPRLACKYYSPELDETLSGLAERLGEELGGLGVALGGDDGRLLVLLRHLDKEARLLRLLLRHLNKKKKVCEDLQRTQWKYETTKVSQPFQLFGESQMRRLRP